MIISSRTSMARLFYAACLSLAFALPAHAQDRITLAFSAATPFANAFVAANEGIFAKHGLEVEMKLVPNSATTPAALIAGSLQVAATTVPNILQAIDQGLDLIALAGGGYYKPGMRDIAVVVRNDSEIKIAKDFEGKRVATAGLNGFLHVLFRKWLTENGANYKKVIFTETALAQQVDVLRAGQVDAILAVQPFLTRVVDQKIGRAVAFYVSDLNVELQSGWFLATRQWALANPKVAAAFRASIEEASALSAKDQSVVRKANLVFIPFPPEVQATFGDVLFKPVLTADDINRWSAIMIEQEMLKKPVDPSQILYTPK